MEGTDFAMLVKHIREVQGLTQEQLARELDVTVGTVNGWENGRHRPVNAQRKRLHKIAEANGMAIPTTDNGDA